MNDVKEEDMDLRETYTRMKTGQNLDEAVSSFTPDDFKKGVIKKGDLFSIPSGLGGAFTIKYLKHVGSKLLFRVTNVDFTEMKFELTPEDAAKRLSEK